MKSLAALVFPFALGACTLLEAEAPLFTVADQAPEFAAPEGLWAAVDESCAADPAVQQPGDGSCLEWMRVGRTPEGAWTLDEPGGNPDETIRALVMAAAPVGRAGVAPLYVVEAVAVAKDEINYAALAPREVRDGRVTSFVAHPVSCGVAAGDWGALDGIVVTRGADGRIVRCVAQAKPAVIEAARRTAIEALPKIEEGALVFVRKE